MGSWSIPVVCVAGGSRDSPKYRTREPTRPIVECMDFTALQDAARAAVPADVWTYYQGTAEGAPDRDAQAWARWDLVPKVLTQLTTIDTTTTIGGEAFASPIMLSPSAGQGARDPEGDMATRRAAASAGVLMGYSFHATIDVERFAAAADAPWWAQAYVTKDRAISDDYLRRCVAGGASAIALTVDTPGTLADVPFRRIPLAGALAVRGNHAMGPDGPIRPVTETSLGPDEIARTAEVAGVPVWVKGVMTAADALRSLDAGAAGIIVSNHARRQLAGVAPTAAVLREVVEGVAGRAPVLVDGGVRSGADVVRALALGAAAVGIGRPVLWALAAGGQQALETVLAHLADEVRVAMAGIGAGRVADLVPDMVRPAFV